MGCGTEDIYYGGLLMNAWGFHANENLQPNRDFIVRLFGQKRSGGLIVRIGNRL